ncbi:MAG: hypothetical protein GX594_12515 [Pirellulaceae bacterium]|nr:hypothetical protein [Pirellulaceae bacterium]
MQIAALYSFNRGKEAIARRYPSLMVDVNQAIKAVDSSRHKTKKNIEKTLTLTFSMWRVCRRLRTRRPEGYGANADDIASR